MQTFLSEPWIMGVQFRMVLNWFSTMVAYWDHMLLLTFQKDIHSSWELR